MRLRRRRGWRAGARSVVVPEGPFAAGVTGSTVTEPSYMSPGQVSLSVTVCTGGAPTRRVEGPWHGGPTGDKQQQSHGALADTLSPNRAPDATSMPHPDSLWCIDVRRTRRGSAWRRRHGTRRASPSVHAWTSQHSTRALLHHQNEAYARNPLRAIDRRRTKGSRRADVGAHFPTTSTSVP